MDRRSLSTQEVEIWVTLSNLCWSTSNDMMSYKLKPAEITARNWTNLNVTCQSMRFCLQISACLNFFIFFSLLKVPIRMIVKFSSCSVYLNFVPAKKKKLEDFHPLPHPLGASVQLVQDWLVFSTISTRHAILITDNNFCIYVVTKISFLH